MHPDVLTILTADEEGRQLVAAAQARLAADVASARAAAEASRAEAARRATGQLEDALQRVETEHASRVRAHAAARATLCRVRAAAAERAMDAAVDLFVRIVRSGDGGPS